MAAMMKAAPIAQDLESEAHRHGAGDAQAGLAKREPDDVPTLVGAPARLGSQQRAKLFEIYSHAYDRVLKRDTLVDAASEMSFPASDPPSYMGGASVVGAPNPETPAEKVNTTVSDPAEVKPSRDDVATDAGNG
ncbi:MAG: hypothetical protein U1E62_00895 [Alsobacter sp.]